MQPLRLWDPVVLAYLGGMTALVGGLVLVLRPPRREASSSGNRRCSRTCSSSRSSSPSWSLALRRRVPVYETFVAGAKEGFQVAVGIIPYLVAMLVAIGILRASGALDLLLDGVR